jgi:hypothetical protein
MTTVADLKRTLQPGTRAKMVFHASAQLSANCAALVGQVREVTKANTVGCYFRTTKADGKEVNSFLDWPKASNIKFTDNGFEILNNGQTFMAYEVLA